MLKETIPFVDLRGKTPVDLLRSYPDKARAIIDGVRRMYGAASYVGSALIMPYADWRSKKLLLRGRSPYVHEVETIADILELRGIYALNMCYEWACTSGVWRHDEAVSMLRVLDWPFPLLGKHTVVTCQQGIAGVFYNVTWPGMSGIYNAMAPGRFCAAINQAPMRKHKRGFALDWVSNRFEASQGKGMPPSHLLRMVFETAPDYAHAKSMLEKTPLAVPAIFVLSGMIPGEGCVIERLESAYETRKLVAGLHVCTTNHFNGSFSKVGDGWWPREIDSAGRYRQAVTIGAHDLEQPDFDWLHAPVINANTRLAIVCNAATGTFMVQGYEGPAVVTNLFKLPPLGYETSQAV
ncbi:MAG: hypothetical protein AB7L92_05730 [Alphaproteobacteria bacterium]